MEWFHCVFRCVVLSCVRVGVGIVLSGVALCFVVLWCSVVMLCCACVALVLCFVVQC